MKLFSKPATWEVFKSCPLLSSFAVMSGTLLLWLFTSHFICSSAYIFRFTYLLSESTHLFVLLPFLHLLSAYCTAKSYLAPATQNMDKYIYTEILTILTNWFYCFIVYAFVLIKFRYYSQVLVHSTVVNSRLSHRYILISA